MGNIPESLTMDDYQFAVYSQEASNLSGLAHDLAKLVDKVWADARKWGEGTDYVNQHPLVRLYVHQMYHLAGLNGEGAWEESYGLVKDQLRQAKGEE